MKSDPDSSSSAPEIHDPAYPSSISFADEAEQTRPGPAPSTLFAKLPAAFIHDSRLVFNDWKVYAALRLHSFKTGFCRPFRGTLTAETGLREQKVSTHTTRLQKFGWIRKEGNGGKNRPCAYRVFDTPEPDMTLLFTPQTVPETGTVTTQTVPETGTVTTQTVPETGTVTTAQTVPETGTVTTQTVPETGTVCAPNGTGNRYRQGRDKEIDKRKKRESRGRAGAGATAGGNEAAGTGTALSLKTLDDFLKTLPDYETAPDWIPLDWTDEAGQRMDEADCLDDSIDSPDNGCCLGFREFWQAAAADGKPNAKKSADGWRLAWLHWVRRAIEFHQKHFPERIEAIRQKKAKQAQIQTATPIARMCGNCLNCAYPLPLPGDTFYTCRAGKGTPHAAAEQYPEVNGIRNCVRLTQAGCSDWLR